MRKRPPDVLRSIQVKPRPQGRAGRVIVRLICLAAAALVKSRSTLSGCETNPLAFILSAYAQHPGRMRSQLL